MFTLAAAVHYALLRAISAKSRSGRSDLVSKEGLQFAPDRVSLPNQWRYTKMSALDTL